VIGDRIFVDVDGDGQFDPGEGLAGVDVVLTGDFNGDGTPDTVTVTTGADGLYSFSGLPTNNVTYTITPDVNDLPPGLVNTADPDGGTPGTSTVTLTAANPTTDTQDFGYRGQGVIGDRIFVDVDGDGAFDPGEGLAGVDVVLTGDFNGDGTPETLTVTTGPDGLYSFSGLPTNNVTYTITPDVNDLPPGLVNTADPDGGTPGTSTVTLTAANPTTDTQDFGYRGTGTIGDRIFIDIDNDGVADPGEGLGGVRITLVGDFNGDGTPETVTTTTAPNGSYTFANLPTNNVTYTVTVDPSTLPPDLTNTFDPNGGNDNTSTVTLTTPNQTNNDQDFGYRGQGVIGDRIFIDRDRDGQFDPGEGLTGVDVTLVGDFNGDGTNETITTTTGADGLYQFTGLPTGNRLGIDYTVAVDRNDLPPGLRNVIDPDGGNNSTAVVNLSPAQLVNNDQDFGYRRPAVPPPVVPQPPDRPEPKPEPEPETPFLFAYDWFNDFGRSGADGNDSLPLISSPEVLREAILPLAPIYSGEADPGATLVVTLYNARGQQIGSQTVMVDSGGNWLASFPSSIMKDYPTDVRIEQIDAPYSFGQSTGRNLRAYFAPVVINPSQFISQASRIMDGSESAPLLGGLAVENPIGLGTVKYGDEVLTTGSYASGR
jgi:hypothetical protein